MTKFINLTFQDPILLLALIFLLSTIFILTFLLKKLKSAESFENGSEEFSDEFSDETNETVNENIKPGLMEARLGEITNQLGNITAKLAEIEKALPKKGDLDKTIQMTASGTEFEKILGKLEAKIDALAMAKPHGNDDALTLIEEKLGGIHRLLILLTDSGNPDNK